MLIISSLLGVYLNWDQSLKLVSNHIELYKYRGADGDSGAYFLIYSKLVFILIKLICSKSIRNRLKLVATRAAVATRYFHRF